MIRNDYYEQFSLILILFHRFSYTFIISKWNSSRSEIMALRESGIMEFIRMYVNIYIFSLTASISRRGLER